MTPTAINQPIHDNLSQRHEDKNNIYYNLDIIILF